MRERHAYVLQVPVADLSGLLTGTCVVEYDRHCGGMSDAEWQRLPPDVLVQGANYQVASDTVDFLLLHDAFPDWPEGCRAMAMVARLVPADAAAPRRGIRFTGGGWGSG